MGELLTLAPRSPLGPPRAAAASRDTSGEGARLAGSGARIGELVRELRELRERIDEDRRFGAQAATEGAKGGV